MSSEGRDAVPSRCRTDSPGRFIDSLALVTPQM
jgi:hypothetical protein